MKVALFVEGCYPYIVGGVSSWSHAFIKNMPDVEFSLNTIVVDKKQMGKFVYELPPNVTKITETALYDDDEVRKLKRIKLSSKEKSALKTLLSRERNSDWSGVFSLFRNNPDISVNSLLMGKDFLEVITSFYNEHYPHVVFSDFLWTMRSLFLPLFLLLKSKPPKADLYHSFSTGYAGILASFAKDTYSNTPLIVTEHGIYTREREEEIIKTDWVKGVYKDIWINNFYNQSSCAYSYADKVVAIYKEASNLQMELGCKSEKAMVISNGVDVLAHENIPLKSENDPFINVGAIVRITPIKDIKTMINAFYQASKIKDNLKLFIMGPVDEDPEYYQECVRLVENLELDNVIFTGEVNVKDYIGKMDIILLTSISESQPLALLEAMSARKPCISTNVGCCSSLFYGEEGDNLGTCGILAPIMQLDAIADAIVKLANNEDLRMKMGEIGKARSLRNYQQDFLYDSYSALYKELPLIKSTDIELQLDVILTPQVEQEEVTSWQA